MKVPQYRYRCPLGDLQPTTPDLDAVKREGWRNNHILVVSEHDERLDWIEKQFVRRLSRRIVRLRSLRRDQRAAAESLAPYGLTARGRAGHRSS